MKRKSNMLKTVLFGIIFLAGLSVMLYPTFSDWWNRNMASHTVSDYQESVSKINDDDYAEIIAEANAYNAQLAALHDPFADADAVAGYDDILNISGTGIMGYVSIPAIQVELPIYHGISEGILQIASGHIRGTSLPVGGASTHAVISGHRGLPSAKLFSDLDKMAEGDIFTVHFLSEELTYEVEKVLVILPTDTEELRIVPGEDLVTLMTCTPYGVNTHRLLIRSHRIANLNERRVKVAADALQIDSMTVIPIVFLPLLGVLFVYWHVTGRLRRRVYIDKYTARALGAHLADAQRLKGGKL